MCYYLDGLRLRMYNNVRSARVFYLEDVIDARGFVVYPVENRIKLELN